MGTVNLGNSMKDTKMESVKIIIILVACLATNANKLDTSDSERQAIAASKRDPNCTPENGKFQCTGYVNKCIPRSWLDDQDNDCGNWSDEPKITGCPGRLLLCGIGGCVSRYWINDGENDCGDWSDEPEMGDKLVRKDWAPSTGVSLGVDQKLILNPPEATGLQQEQMRVQNIRTAEGYRLNMTCFQPYNSESFSLNAGSQIFTKSSPWKFESSSEKNTMFLSITFTNSPKVTCVVEPETTGSPTTDVPSTAASTTKTPTTETTEAPTTTRYIDWWSQLFD